ncbi:MAG: DNA-3-methyladenine glycosylase family protein [Acidimicrobiia bacterium]
MATRRVLGEAADELARRDRALGKVVREVGPPDLRRGRPRREHFAELARAILYQQLAGSAARAITARFDALFEHGRPTPEAVLARRVSTLRKAGLSGSKVASIRDLAAKTLSGDVDLDRIARRSDDEVVRQLTQVRGIGRWTAEMFLIFQLGRLDVWPIDDYGVRKGYARIYALPELLAAKEMEPRGDAYRPYRSVAAWYCWRAADTATPDGQGGTKRATS